MTGANEPESVTAETRSYRYTTLNILTMAVVAAVGGVVSAWLILPVGRVIEGALGPFGTAITNPPLSFWGVLIGVLIARPGSALLGSFLTGVVEVLAGSLDGSIVLVFVAVQGVGAELGMAMFRYKRPQIAGFVACGLAAAFGGIVTLYVFGFVELDPLIQVVFLTSRFVGGVVIGGLLTYAISAGLKRTGAWGATEA